MFLKPYQMLGHAFARHSLAVVLVLTAAWRTAAAADCPMPAKPANLASATVERVSDGDTVILRFPDGRRQRTRLLGIGWRTVRWRM